MKLLIITQKIDFDDPVLGFFHRWVEEFSTHCESIVVICLGQGNYNLPSNVKVLSLGKERGASRFGYVCNFYKYLWQENVNYDKVFVHMNPIYFVLAGWWWKLLRKKTGLWYTHRQVDLKLRIAEKFADIIFTAAKESFSLESNKLKIVGHGIDTVAFNCLKGLSKEDGFAITHVGRITPIKNLETLIGAMKLLKKEGLPVKVLLLGEPIKPEDFTYKQKLERLIHESGLSQDLIFKGAVSNKEIIDYYCQSNLTINLTPTGGIDKTVLESMASGVPVIVSNEAFRAIFDFYADKLIFKFKDAGDLYLKIRSLLFDQEIIEIKKYLKERSKSFDIKSFIGHILYELEKVN